ncbi:MAG: hypothetical protein ABSH52_08025 [Terriglobia bacterium]|jgi:uncharacterized coiled-coil protein SlyX
MNRQIARIAVLVVMVSWGAGLALAQEPPSSDSLADLARQAKAQRAKSHEKPKVYTNEDIQALPPLPMVTTDAKPGNQAAQETAGNKAEHPSPKPGPAGAGSQKHGEEYFRDRMGRLEERLELDRRELTVLNQKLGQSQMMYYSDPVRGLLQSSGPTAMSDVHGLQDRIAAKQAEIDKDQEAIDDLHEELRRAGGDPGWLRNVPPGEPRAQPEGKGGKDWDSRFKLARARLADAEEQLHVSQEELKLLRIQVVQTLNSGTKADLDGKVKDKEDEISQKQEQKDEAEKALDELQKEYEASGEAVGSGQ